MREKVNKTILEDLKNDKMNKGIEVSLNNGLLDVTIDGKEYKGLTPEEVAQRFGTNYYIVQNLRYLFEGEEIEETIQGAQSLKKEVIDIFIKTLEKKNVFEGILSIEEIREKLEQNIDAVYVSNDTPSGKSPAGTFEVGSKNLYIKGNGENLEEIKQAILSGKVKDLIKMDLLGIICHETIHAVSTKGFVSGFNDPYKSGFVSINEGITEILAKEMVPDSVEAYTKEVETAKYWLAIFGREEVLKTYLNADREALRNIAKEKDVLEDFDRIIKLSDDRSRAWCKGKDTTEADLNIYDKMGKLINSIGSIDISGFVENDIPIPKGINSEIIAKGISEEFLRNQKFGETEYFKQLSENYPIVHIETIDLKNKGEIDFKEYVKQGLVYYNEHIIAQHFHEKGKDFKEFCMSIKGAMDIMEEKHGRRLQGLVGALLSQGTEILNDNPELTEFKRNVIEEIVYGDFGMYTNTERNEGCSWKEKISRIDNFEYYTTEDGRFLVDLENGEMIGKYQGSEIINMEETEFLQTSSEERNTKGIRYTSKENGTQIFFTEKDKNGKFVLKGYTINGNGNYEELDVGLGRNFLEDTTELDRQLISRTSEVRSGSIKRAAKNIKRDISKDEKEKEER